MGSDLSAPHEFKLVFAREWSRFSTVFGAVFLALTELFGNEFLKFSLHGVTSCFFLFVTFLGTDFVVSVFSGASRKVLQIEKSLIAWSAFVGSISLLGLYQPILSWNLIEFDVGYFSRQYYFLPLMFLQIAWLAHLTWRQKIKDFLALYLGVVFCLIALRYLALGDLQFGWWSVLLGPVALPLLANHSWLRRIWILVAVLITTQHHSASRSLAVLLWAFLLEVPARFHARFLKLAALGGSLVILFLSVVAVDWIKLWDGNSWWRFVFWRHEFLKLLGTFGLGVGFGTAYFDQTLATEITIESSRQQPLFESFFVVAQHNSWVNWAFRLGVVGVVLLAQWLSALLDNISSKSGIDDGEFNRRAVSGFFAAAMIIGALNVGLESPRNAVFIVFALGLLRIYSFQRQANA